MINSTYPTTCNYDVHQFGLFHSGHIIGNNSSVTFCGGVSDVLEPLEVSLFV